MTPRVGLPQGLLHYHYGAVWERFFQELGTEVVISGETTREILEVGGILDEICLPAKVYYGHACKLIDRVDYLFVPRLVSVSHGQYTCPKIIGMPDMLRGTIQQLPPVIDTEVNLRRNTRQLFEAITSVGRLFGKSAVASLYAWYRSWQYRRKVQTVDCGYTERLRVALIGHSYIIYDRQVSMNVLARLESLNVQALTPEMVTPREASTAAKRLGKQIFWSNGYHLAGAAVSFMYSSRPLDGIIFMTCFSCGQDALIGEVVRYQAQKLNIPYMILSLDEHTAEAGFVTRLEAFVDMLHRRCKS